jgi:DNA-binding GntR family transcriptional regulator
MQGIAFQAIKQAIIRNELSPGNIYSEQAIAKEMGMSKTPVHQALLDLENKGFVTILPRKGFEVNALSAKNIRDMFELRRALERTVILKITPKLTTDDIQELKSIIQQIEQNRDPLDFQKYDRAFHRHLASLSNNTYIINALSTVWDLSDWVGASILYDWGGFSQAAGEHLAVYEYMTAGEAEKAAAAMERHLNGTESRFLERFTSKKHKD